ncbi:hypothetical protein R69888_02531 [Paraburkholderia haematera]|uniref:Uncharacterized protein n=2 Tax=Paraburkholderia haematera TaxID=2793077 RepID=A0ABN7LDJ3_9BURK|nr:hypothetical protein R69888_02531 [Paraburkholderia haematera]
MRRSNYLSTPSDSQRHIPTLRLSHAAWLLIALCNAGTAHTQTDWNSSSTNKGSYAATYGTYSDDTSDTESDYTALVPRQSSLPPSSSFASTGTHQGSTSRRSASATSRSALDSSFTGNTGTSASRAARSKNRSVTDPTSSDYMGQSDTDAGSYMTTTLSPKAGARATGSKNRALKNIDAGAPGIYLGGQYRTTDDASAIYAPAWKADPYPVY